MDVIVGEVTLWKRRVAVKHFSSALEALNDYSEINFPNFFSCLNNYMYERKAFFFFISLKDIHRFHNVRNSTEPTSFIKHTSRYNVINFGETVN